MVFNKTQMMITKETIYIMSNKKRRYERTLPQEQNYLIKKSNKKGLNLDKHQKRPSCQFKEVDLNVL
jgi:hypothetical protein